MTLLIETTVKVSKLCELCNTQPPVPYFHFYCTSTACQCELFIRVTCPCNVYPLIPHFYMSRVMRKPDFCLCENKGADQLRSNCEADQRLCFRYTDSTLSLLIKSEISSFYAASGTVHVGLCQTWLETPKTGFLASRLI